MAGRVSVASGWTVGEVARVAHVTVRTLHHYDEIGLLVPSGRSGSGYRLYSESDLERLHQILLYRELEFSLDTIGQLLDGPALDRGKALRVQRQLLLERRQRTDAVIRAIDRSLEAMEQGVTMSTDELFEGFRELAQAPEDVRAHHREHAAEAREQWGGTDAYGESMRRARKYRHEDWEAIKAEGDANEERMVDLMRAGADPEGPEARAVAESMREHITRWFYPCSVEMHAGLADMYEADARFRAYYEKRAEGYASYVAAAIRANAIDRA
jgi:MerR family transcriptional regulator, thiopeptide resistance regulator